MNQRNKRVFQLDSISTRTTEANEEIVTIAISSETPYLRQRLNGHQKAYEVLGHTDGEILLDYIDGAPFCFEHDTDNQIGVLENVQLGTDKVLRADVRFSSLPFAQNIQSDMQRGIRKRISVGYDVLEYADVGQAEDGYPIVRAVKWRIYEASTVSIPADMTVGVGKSILDNGAIAMKDNEKAEDAVAEAIPATVSPDVVSAIVEQVLAALSAEGKADSTDVVDAEQTDGQTATDAVPQDEETEVKGLFINTAVRANSNKGVSQMNEQEKALARKAEISKVTELAVKHGATDKLSGWLSDSVSYNDVAAQILEGKSNTDSVVIGAPALHLKKRDNDFTTSVKAFLGGDNSEVAERGISAARAFGTTVNPNTLYIAANDPIFQSAKFARAMQRDATYGMGGSGANMTGKEYMTFEETLREGSLLARVGGEIRSLSDIGHVPYFSTPATASMYSESGSVSNTSVEVGSRTWTPKRIAARYEFTNLMGALNGTYDIESELYKELVGESIRIFDAQIWGGTGANNITGIAYDTNVTALNQSGSFTTLGSGSAMITAVAKQNGNVENGAFVVSHDVFSGLFSNGVFGAGSGQSVLQVLQESNPVLRTGYVPVISTKQVAIFGDFSKVTAATFGPIAITRDNLTALATGKTVLSLEMFADSVVRQPASLVKWTNITP